MKGKKLRFLRGGFLPFVLVCLLIFLLRLPYATKVVIDWDESNYFVSAQDLVNGGTLYQTTWSNKPPILFFIFTPVIKTFGNNILALRFFTTFYLFLSMFFVYLICKNLFSSQIAIVGPLVYGIFFSLQKFGGQASNRGLFMMLPILIATFFFIEYDTGVSRKRLNLFFCGFFSAAAILTIQTSLFSIVLFPLILILKKIKMKEYFWKTFLSELSWYLFGGAIISIIILGYLIANNALYDFYYATWLYNDQLTSSISIEDALERLFSFLEKTVKSDAITIMALISGLFIILNDKLVNQQKRLKYFVLSMLVLSLLGVFGARNMWPHYYLQMSLVFSILICFGISMLEINEKYLAKVIPAAILIFIIISLSSWPKFLESHKTYRNDEYYKIAEYLTNKTTEQDTIYVLGGQPIIYFLSDRASPTRFFFWHVFKHKKTLQKISVTEDTVLNDLYKNEPRYIVYHKEKGNEVEFIEKFMLDNYYNETTIGSYDLYRVNESELKIK